MRLTVACDVIRLASVPRETMKLVSQPLAYPWQAAGTRITTGTEIWLAAMLFCDTCKGDILSKIGAPRAGATGV